MKQNKFFSLIKIIISTILIISFLFSVGIGTFLFSSFKDLKTPTFEELTNPKSSIILDSSSQIVEDFSINNESYIKYEDLPPLLINALLSIEDNEFFYHKGINPKRIISAFISNLDPSNWIQGGSTITQQLIKNTILSNEKTYTRKVKEAYLAYLLERKMSKEEILENFFNRIYFEQSYPGISYASKTFFDKDVKSLSLVECATLVGLIKSPSQYYPYTNIEKTNKRKNDVLDAMYKNNVITKNECELSKRIHISSYLKKKTNLPQYKYQAYLDVVYEECKKLLNIDLYKTPVKVETYLDTSLQTKIDSIQNDDSYFQDDSLQIGGAILSNNDASIVGIIGGRNYLGKKVFNRSYSLKRSPASTIKPIFSYALGIKHHNYHALSSFEDETYYYPKTSIEVKNADKRHMGKITLIEALAYSRNTCALKELELLQKEYGEEYLISYLKDINLWDNGHFSLSYGLGGMTYGVSPIALASAYSMLPRGGEYIYPSTIKRITSLKDNKVLYEREINKKRILSYEDSSILVDIMKRVINSNVYSIKDAKPNGINIGGKTGTNAYDSASIRKYNIPSSSDKDIWFSGFSPSYTISIWSGFDKFLEGKNTYFSPKDKRKKIPKKLFKDLMSYISPKNEDFTYSSKLKKVTLVKGTSYSPNELIPSSYIDYALIKDNMEITSLPSPSFQEIKNVNLTYSSNILSINILDELKSNDIYRQIYGEEVFEIIIKKPNMEVETYTLDSYSFSYLLELEGRYEFNIHQTFKKNNLLKGKDYSFTYDYKNDFHFDFNLLNSFI